eukprot:c45885_g1_i1 orf=2-166(-)
MLWYLVLLSMWTVNADLHNIFLLLVLIPLTGYKQNVLYMDGCGRFPKPCYLANEL